MTTKTTTERRHANQVRAPCVRTGIRAGAVAAESDQFAQVRGFKVEITNAGGAEVDTAWDGP